MTVYQRVSRYEKERPVPSPVPPEEMTRLLLYCDNCTRLYPKEHEQTSKKEPHLCSFLDTVRKHNGEYPRIPAPAACVGYNNGDRR